jgi:hypothetical protein
VSEAVSALRTAGASDVDELLRLETGHWVEVSKANRQARRMADRHYSFFGKPMSHEVGPPGQKIILLTADGRALWGSHRPAPWAGIVRADGLEGHHCFIFRNEGYAQVRSSDLIREAVSLTLQRWGPGDFWTYVGAEHVASENPGYCFLVAGWRHDGWVESAKLGRLRRLKLVESEVLS